MISNLQVLRALDSVPLSVCKALLPLNRPRGKSKSHLDVELEGRHGLLQHRRLLLLRQLDAVHAAPVQLLEAVGAGHAGEGEKRQPLFAAQPKRLLGDFSQHLSS